MSNDMRRVQYLAMTVVAAGLIVGVYLIYLLDGGI